MSEISDGSTPKPTILLPPTENTDIKTDGITAPETLHSPTKYFKNMPRLTGLFFQEEFISDDDTITLIYNQLFDTPVTYVGDDTWEEEFNEDEDEIVW